MEKLFEKFNIGTMELKNRIVMPAIGTWFANDGGTVSQHLIDYYARRAEGGAGLIVVEASSIDPVQIMNPRQIRIDDDKFIPGLSTLASSIKAHQAKAAIQLYHPGRETHTMITGVQPVAPSPIPCPIVQDMPKELSEQEIKVIIDEYADGARRAKEAGFDAVEMHGAHGYLICQFLSSFSNKRNDQYGGDLYRRARFATEIVERTREKVGSEFPIIFRISADERLDGGLTLEETRIIAKLLEEAGINAISVSAGNFATIQWVIQPVLLPRGCLVPFAAEIRKVVQIPVITAGRINDPKLADTILKEGKADLIAMGRPLMADPDLPRKALEGRHNEIRRCIACNTCILFTPDQVHQSRVCLLNPELGREGEPETRATNPKKLLVIGGEPAGLEAARVASIRGHDVTLWDENENLGGRWSWLIKPYIREQLIALKQLGVKVELGKSINSQSVASFHPDAVIATMGLTPVFPHIPGIGQDNVFTANDVLEEKAKVRGKVVILGGGNIGCQCASFLHRKVADITMIESGPMMGHGLELNTARVFADNLLNWKVRVLNNTEVISIGSNMVLIKDKDGKEKVIQADNVILALGSKPDDELIESLKSSDFKLFPVTPCERPQDAYKSSQEGASIARKI